MSGPRPVPPLLGRRDECERLSSLLAAAKAGRSQVLVLRGEAGIGKTALLEYLFDRATGCRVARAAGVESEMELAHAGLHQLCGPFLGGLPRLPPPQRDALATAFGLRPGGPPDRLLVGLAVLTLLTGVAEERPLVCLVDDAQWLDRATADVLAFVARRLAADPVAVVFAAREPDGSTSLDGLPEMFLRGLRKAEAEALLRRAVNGPLDARVLDRILAECQGNPLALLELPRVLSPAELSLGGATVPDRRTVVPRIEQGFLAQVRGLEPPVRRLLLAAAADPTGDLTLLRRAAGSLGTGPEAYAAAEASGLVEMCDRVRFRHPLVRSAVSRSATSEERRAVHRALAEATDPELDPDRRAWHRSSAAVGPDEAVAEELERSAGRALSHGGLAAAAAMLEQAATLTPDPVRRLQRVLDAAEAAVRAGALDDARALLATIEQPVSADAARSRMLLLEAEVAFAVDGPDVALPLLLDAARRLEPIDPVLAWDTHLDALSAALFAGRLGSGAGAREVARAIRRAPPPPRSRRSDALLEALAIRFTAGFGPAASPSHRAVQDFLTAELTLDEALRSAWLATATAASLWDDAGWDLLSRRHLVTARGSGARSVLPVALTNRTVLLLFTGDLVTAAALIEEVRSLTDITGSALPSYGAVGLAAVRGVPSTAEPLIRELSADVLARGQGVGATMTEWARAVLCNGLGRYQEALAAARQATADVLELGFPQWALAELVEAAVHSGEVPAAEAALRQLSELADASATDWALGVAASRRALVADRDEAEALHEEALERLSRTRMRLELARAQLLYGEWLRRGGRRVDARVQLRTAHEALTAMGAVAFADRAGHELLATGETVRRRSVETAVQLTAQESHIARLAAQGLTNPEIGSALYISPRTVEWHLRKAFLKLGVSSRRDLRRALGGPPEP
jgi:DNA-binding CsgD family transcriptional regulator/tetratricopeptide (TPR) repeat protein